VNLKYKISDEFIIPGNLTKSQITKLLFSKFDVQEELFAVSREIRNTAIGSQCFLRAVIEISNFCSNSCEYCSMSRNNVKLPRFILSINELIDAISLIEKNNIKTVMFQSGDNIDCYNLLLAALKRIDYNKTEIIGCVGNLNIKQLKELKKNNIGGYIIKFETSNEELFYKLRGNHLQNRLKVVENLRKLNIQCGSGIILGLPGETTDDIANSLLLLQNLMLPMNSVSPFIPSKYTNLEKHPKASLSQTLNFIALLRISNPTSLIPSVSALNLLDKNGQSLGLKAGANTLTVNFTPLDFRKLYNIYDEKRIIVESDYAHKVAENNQLAINSGSSTGFKIGK
jgi:biotin synthase